MGYLLLSLIKRVLQEQGVEASYRQIVEAFAALKLTAVQSSAMGPALLKLNRVEGIAASILKIFPLKRLLSS